MPTYQYACTECGHQFETVQSFTDEALTECPQCTGRLRKVFNAVGIVFKGSGFYRNDSREKAPAASTTGKGEAADKGSGEPKKAAPPAAKDAKPGKDATKPSKGSGGAGSSGGSRSSTASSTAGSAA